MVTTTILATTTLTTATTLSTKKCCSSKSSSSVPPLITALTARRKTNANTRRRKRRTTTRRRATTSRTSHEDAFEAKSPTTKKSKNLKCELVSNVANRFTVKGTILLGAHVNADDVYNMLTDYENASRVFASTIKKVEYLGFEEEVEDGEARRPGAVKRIKQTCNWKFFIFGGNFNIELGVVENDAKRHMMCTLEGAASQRKFGFLREFEGSWEVEENGEEGTKVTHVLSVKPSLTPPYASDIFVKQVEGILEDVEREVGSWENGYAVPMHRR